MSNVALLKSPHGQNPPMNPLDFRYVVAEEIDTGNLDRDYRSFSFLAGAKTPQDALAIAKQFAANGSPITELTLFRIEEIPIEWEIDAKLVGFENKDNIKRIF